MFLTFIYTARASSQFLIPMCWEIELTQYYLSHGISLLSVYLPAPHPLFDLDF